jgi:hypothetical protein
VKPNAVAIHVHVTLLTPWFSKIVRTRFHAAMYSAGVPFGEFSADSGSWLKLRYIGCPNVLIRRAHETIWS